MYLFICVAMSLFLSLGVSFVRYLFRMSFGRDFFRSLFLVLCIKLLRYVCISFVIYLVM